MCGPMSDGKLRGIREPFPEEAVFIVGAGHFGGRAARILSRRGVAGIYVLDLDETSLAGLEDLPVTALRYDGVLFLAENFPRLHPTNTIVPAIPVHLAYEWLKRSLEGHYHFTQIPVPKEVKERLPHTWPGGEGSLLASYADFLCPDDCPEPDVCTVTGERREMPMHALLRGVAVPEFKVHMIRSRQLAPGLGGYAVEDLSRAAEAIAGKKEMNKWLLGTACKCHGILTAFEIRFASKNRERKD